MRFKALLATKHGGKISTNNVELEVNDRIPGNVAIAVDKASQGA